MARTAQRAVSILVKPFKIRLVQEPGFIFYVSLRLWSDHHLHLAERAFEMSRNGFVGDQDVNLTEIEGVDQGLSSELG